MIQLLRNWYIISYDTVTKKWFTKNKKSKYITLTQHSTYEKARAYINKQMDNGEK